MTIESLLSTPPIANLHNLTCRWLGRQDYGAMLQLQDALVKHVLHGPANAPEHLLLLEHDPVYTIGRLPDKSSLRDASSLPYPLVEISRGGQATYHGPGQLVGYPILELKRHLQDLHEYLRCLEELVIQVAGHYRVAAQRREGFTGVWVGNKKLASIGVGVRQWVTLHGFAMNVLGPLEGFAAITPCGIQNVEMTSLEAEGATLASVADCANITGQIAVELLGKWGRG
jgi:lipoyl(octanoyl) transferase